MHVCSGCGLVMSDIQPADSIQSEFARVDADAYDQSIGLVRQQQAKQAISLVRSHLGDPRGLWLDIGCSFGYLLREAQQAGYEVLGMEPDETACSRARELVGHERVHHGLLSEDLVSDGSVDVVSTMDVLEHIPTQDLMGFALLVKRKLRSGGVWLIKVPTTDGIYFRAAHLLARVLPSLVSGVIARLWQSEYEFPHTVYFNEGSLGAYLRRHGFEMLERQYLEEIPVGTVRDRIAMDDSISKRSAYALALGAYAVNSMDRLRGTSDALLAMAQPRPDR